ncbi:MAG: NAD/NADP-dependent octopine/nopaline dehydrogenase family protein [Deferrisomatales bacterium]
MIVAVLGAGHGGLATAGHLGLKGHEVRLFSFYRRETDPVRDRKGIRLEGGVEGVAPVARVASGIDEAVAGAELIIAVTPALAHRTLASLLAPCLEDGQILLLTPGRTGGALEVYRELRRLQVRARAVVAECQTLLYAAESRGPAHVEVMKVKHRVRAAALPARDTSALMDAIGALYGEYVEAESVLETSLNNVGAVVHPAPMLLNSGLLERAARGEDLRYYKDIITRFVCTHVMERIDREKSAVARAVGAKVLGALAWYEECYGVTGGDLYEVLQKNPYYQGFSAPRHVLGYHHVLDEVPNSLVPLEAFGRAAGVATPTISALVDLAGASLEVDFRAEGRTLERLGLGGMGVEAVREFVTRGPRFWEP